MHNYTCLDFIRLCSLSKCEFSLTRTIYNQVSVPICYLERVCDCLRRKCRMITGHWTVGSVSSEERKINLMLRHLKEKMSDEFLFLGFEISHIYLGPACLIFSQLFPYKACLFHSSFGSF